MLPSVYKNILKSIKHLDINENEKKSLFGLLKNPDTAFEFSLKVKENGEIKSFKAYRIHHSNLNGIYKGGLRIDKNVCYEDTLALSILMTLKNSLIEIPFGGAKGGIQADIKKTNQNLKEKLVRAYAQSIHRFIDEDTDSIAPDLNTKEKDMNIFFDEFSRIKGKNAFSIVTGKSEGLMGLRYRKYSTGFGIGYITKRAIEDFIGKKDVSVAIQGFGNVGSNAARKIKELGFKIIAVSDSRGGVFCSRGIDINELIEIKEKEGKVSALIKYKNNCELIDVNDFIKINCDVLILAARENVINMENVEEIKAKLLIEGANSPITANAEEILLKNKKTIIPDILANSGGVIASYFEWLKGKGNLSITDKYVDSIVKEKLLNAYAKVKKISEDKEKSFREGAIILALQNIYKKAKLRGVL